MVALKLSHHDLEHTSLVPNFIIIIILLCLQDGHILLWYLPSYHYRDSHLDTDKILIQEQWTNQLSDVVAKLTSQEIIQVVFHVLGHLQSRSNDIS